MSEPMTAADFASKVEWEGGVMEALDYGLKPSDAPEGPIRDAWARLYQVWQRLSPIADEMFSILDSVERDDEDGEGGAMSDSMENFRRYVDDSANLLALDLAALLNRAYALGVAVCPDTDEDEGNSYSIEWAFKASRHLDVEWDAERKRWSVTDVTVEGMPR